MFENKKVAKSSQTNPIKVFKAISFKDEKTENRTSENKSENQT